MTCAARTDANQAEIVDALRRAGASVHCTHREGDGFPDVVCGFRGVNYLLEIKTEHGELNAMQREWHDAWRGQKAVVRSVDDALRVIGAVE